MIDLVNDNTTTHIVSTHSIGIPCGQHAPNGKPYCQPQENNILGQRMAEYCPGKVATLKSRFEGQSQNKEKRFGFSPGASDREGIYAQIDETQMKDFNPPKQQEEKIKRTVVNV